MSDCVKETECTSCAHSELCKHKEKYNEFMDSFDFLCEDLA